MKKSILILFLFCGFSSNANEPLIQDKLIFESVIFPFPEFTYKFILDEQYLTTHYTRADAIKIVKACIYFNDYKTQKLETDDILRMTVCKKMKEFLKKGIFQDEIESE